MTARVQIQIEAQDASTGVLRAITSQFGALGSVMSDAADVVGKTNAAFDLYKRGLTDTSISVEDVQRAEEQAQAATARLAEAITMLAIDIMRDAINNVIEYAGEVENLARMSGMTAEQSSRMLQVLDDFKITADDVTMATRKMTQNGFAPSLDTIAQLSDQYLLLNNAQERNSFLIENFGRSGAQWAKVLEQGSDAILTLNDAVSENLILNQKQIEAADALRLQQDALSDSGKGLLITFGAYMTPALSALTGILDGATNGLADFFEEMANNRTISIETSRILKEQGYLTESINTATAEQIAAARELAIANIEAANGTRELVAAEEDAVVDYENLIDSMVDYQDEIDRYMDKNEDLKASEADLIKQKQDLLAQIEDLKNKGYSETGETIQGVQEKVDGVNEKLDENKKKLAENEEAHRKWAAQTVFAFAQARAAADGSISEVEGKLLIDAGQALGLFDENTAKTMQNVNSAFDSLDTSNAQEVIDTLVEQLEALTNEPWTITVGVEAEPLPTPPPSSSNGSTSSQPYITGGEVYAGNMLTVGEGGTEPFIPSVNGRILGHAESLRAMSLGGGANYFYGNVTLQIGEGEAGGLLEYR